MKCPVDGAELRMTERQGVEIDYCPQCRGVWLDRGELDKIIDRQSAETASVPRNRPVREPQRDRYAEAPRGHDIPPRHYQDGGYHKAPKYPKYKYKKRKSLLSEIFDFD